MPSVIESQWAMEITRRTAVWHSDSSGGEPGSSDAPPEPLRVYDYKGLRWHREDAERKRVGKQSKRTQAQVRVVTISSTTHHLPHQARAWLSRVEVASIQWTEPSPNRRHVVSLIFRRYGSSLASGSVRMLRAS